MLEELCSFGNPLRNSGPRTHHRPNECPLGILLQLLQRIRLVLGSLHDRTRLDPLLGEIIDDVSQLIRRRRGLRHVELELAALVLAMVRVVARLVDRGRLPGGRAGGAENIQDARGHRY